MDYDDVFDNGYDIDPVQSGSGLGLSNDQGGTERNLDPFDLRDPVNAYFCLSDDAQDEIQNPQNQKLRCLLCGHEFMGQKMTGQCPICYGTVSQII